MSVNSDSVRITELLKQWSAGDVSARDAVMTLVYRRIHQLAVGRLRASAGAVQPTELANELMLNLLEANVNWGDRIHFFRTVAVAMRNILLDLARRSAAAKHGGGLVRVTLSAAEGQEAMRTDTAEALYDALQTLRTEDSRKADVVELHYLVGLGLEEISRILGVSLTTVNRDMRYSRAWLKERLSA